MLTLGSLSVRSYMFKKLIHSAYLGVFTKRKQNQNPASIVNTLDRSFEKNVFCFQVKG